MMESRHQSRSVLSFETPRPSWQRPVFLVTVALAALGLLVGLSENSSSFPYQRRTRLATSGPLIKVFSGLQDHPVASMQRRTFEETSEAVEHIMLSLDDQEKFLRTHSCGQGVVERFEELRSHDLDHLAQELWKYCALAASGGMYLDSSSPLLASVDTLLSRQTNIAVWSDSSFADTLHGSLLLLRDARSPVAIGMVKVLLETPIDTLQATPLLIPRTLNDLVQAQVSGDLSLGDNGNGKWLLLEQNCSVDPLRITGKDRISSYRPDSLRYVLILSH